LKFERGCLKSNHRKVHFSWYLYSLILVGFLMNRKKDKILKFERGYLKSNHRKVHFLYFCESQKADEGNE